VTVSLEARLAQLLAQGHAGPRPVLRGDRDFAPPGTLRQAAVLIAVTDRRAHADGPGVLLIHRPSNMRAHPGQAAFPGGKLDPGETPREAALREAWEELGIHERDVTVVGETDRYQTGTGYDITPVLAVVPPDLPLDPNPTEVAAWFEPPFGFVLDAANQIEHAGDWQGQTRHYLEILWNEHRIWGVTAGIIANLAQRVAWHADA
jgi:8-oxo-dGTP pyrophosphatase MutT (NUDIX family)